MRRVLIAGCGYLGAATADLFHTNKWSVEGWTASQGSAEQLSTKPYPVRPIDFTLGRPETQAFDIVIHCASTRGGDAADYRRVYFEGARNLSQAFPDAVLIFTSSTSVYAQVSGEWVNELSPAEPRHEAGKILRETEELVISRGGIVARLAGIYGPGRSALLRKFLSGGAVIDAIGRYVNQVHRDDAASALSLLAEKRTSVARQIFNVSDGHPMLERECYEWLAAQLNRPIRSAAASSSLRKRGWSNKRVSSEKLQSLGWQPRFPDFQSAMMKSILPNLKTCGA